MEEFVVSFCDGIEEEGEEGEEGEEEVEVEEVFPDIFRDDLVCLDIIVVG